MVEVKRQHYVPRTYLKNFSSERGDKYFIKALPSANCIEEAIYESSTLNICLQTGLYTLPGETEQQRMLIEKFYSDNYEAYYDEVYQILTNPTRKTITEAERELIISTVVTMFYRTTKWINQHNTFFNRVLENAYALAKNNGFDYIIFEKEKVSIANKTLEQLQKEYKFESRPSQVITQLETALSLIKWRTQKDTIMVVKIIDDPEYITSDNPVAYDGPSGKNLAPFDAENILKLPLDPKHLLLLMPYGNEENKLNITRSERSGIASENSKLTSNYSQLLNSERFLLGTDKGLKSYISTKQETERPLSDEENLKFDKIDSDLEKMLKEIKLK
ncbi:DUF4238 domain-containing protein [Flavobacterium panici]|uniref:DUF4238 domain-containing protein n=1 Tax=Flavobacterium panici TaxID=2654843 RepID=A0A9N8J1D3_9FLAO|nr:DUF4238 domain-containing protein [Flavobacterium panici]CAC9974439.1 hypothetical protein FLAPXU55_02136 [Flavobacterium panici]